MRIAHVSTVRTPEGETIVVRCQIGHASESPVDLVVWPGGGFTHTLAAFRSVRTRQTLHIFEAAEA